MKLPVLYSVFYHQRLFFLLHRHIEKLYWYPLKTKDLLLFCDCRLDCMTRMKEHTADWEAVDPEDMYIAAKRFGDAFSVVKEIRTKEEPDGREV